jgi:hypothetical protein
MRNLLHAGIVALLLTPAATDVRAQTAGAKKLGVAVIERNDIIKGWSARHQISQSVNNDKDEKIGKVEDIIFTPERLLRARLSARKAFSAGVRTTSLSRPRNSNGGFTAP